MKLLLMLFTHCTMFLCFVYESSYAQSYASLPYNQNFEGVWVNSSGTRDVPSLNWKNTPPTGNESWSREDDGKARGAWTNDSPYSPTGANGTLHSAAFNSWGAYSDGILDLYINFSTLSGYKALYFYYFNSMSREKLEISISTNGGTSFGTPIATLGNYNNWTKITLDLGNLTSTTGVIRFKAKNDYAWLSSVGLGIDEIYVGSHSTTPIVANFTASATNGTVPLTVTFTNSSSGDVTKWDWDFNNDGITDANTQNPIYTFYQSGTTTVKLTSSKPGFSDSKTINISTTPQVYAALPFKESFDNTWINREATRDVPSMSFKNLPSTGPNSWRRFDDGSSAGWIGRSPSPDYAPIGAKGSAYSARFNSRETDLVGTMDIFVDFSTQSGNKVLSFWYINSGGTDKLEVLLSTDGGVNFGSALVTKTIEDVWTKVLYDFGSINTKTGVVRFKATTGGGLDIGIDEILISNQTAVNVDAHFATDRISGTAPLSVNFTDQSNGAPISWNWDFNNDGTIDATTQNPSYTYLSSGIYTVKLTAGKAGSTSTEVQTNKILVSGYSALPLYENFENTWVSRDNNRDVPSQYWKNIPATGDNSWSRSDDGLLRGAWNSDNGEYSPIGANGSNYSAMFNSYSSYNLTGSLDLAVNFSSQVGQKRLIFWYINKGGNDKLEVFVSTDGGTTFGTSKVTMSVESIWKKVILDIGNLTAPNGIIRFKATTINFDATNTNIGIDDISVTVPTLLPLNADFLVNKTSGPAPLSVNFSDISDGAPTSWSWDFNNDGVVDATTQNPSYTYNNPGNYTVKQTITKNSSSDTETKTNQIVVTGYAKLPFKESFEGIWVNRDNLRDVPSAFVKNTPATGYNSWSRDDDGVARGAWYSINSPFSPTGADGTNHSARFIHGFANGTLDFFIDFSSMTGGKTLSFWFKNPAWGQIDVYLSTDGGTTFGSSLKTLTRFSTWEKTQIDLGNITTATGVIRFVAKPEFSGSEDMGLDEVVVKGVSADFISNATMGISPFTVSFTDQSLGNPTSWKWDFNNDGTIDATEQNPTFTFNASGNYDVKLVALNSGTKDSIVKISYIKVLPIQYATLPFTENFDNAWINLTNIRDVPSVNWQNTPATGSNSWSRDDDGQARGAWTSMYGSYSPTGSNGSAHSARINTYHTYLAGSLDLFVNLSTLAGDKALYFYYINTSGTDKLDVLASTDGGKSFGSPLFTLGIKTTWTRVAIDLGSNNAASSIIRFKATGDYGNSDIGIDNITVGVPTTTSVKAAFSANKTMGIAPVTVNFTDESTGDATAWKWDFNNDGIIESTQQNPTYTYTSPGSYSVKLIAQKSGKSDTLVKSSFISVLPQPYATLPFVESFDKTWIDRDNSRDVPSGYFRNFPATGNNSWTRYDDNSRALYGNTNSFYTPQGAMGSLYSARFFSYGSNSLCGTMDIFVDFSTQFGFQELSFWYINTSGTDKLEVFLSKDGGLTFGSALETLTTKSIWTKVRIDLGFVTAPKGVVRIVATGDGGNSDIGIDELIICDQYNSPIKANISADKTSGTSPLLVTFTDESIGTATSWSWDFNNDGVIDATSQNPNYTFNTPGSYNIKMKATNDSSSDSITKLNYIVVTGYASLPFVENFDNNWMTRNNLRDVPSPYFKSNPSTGNNSWSRDDDGMLRGAWSNLGASYSPSGSSSNHSARFHSYGTSQSGILDLFVNFSTMAGNKTLSFWYLNTSGSDSIQVYLSTDGGATDGTLVGSRKLSANWTKLSYNLGNVTASTGVIRIKAKGDWGYSDIGIDEVRIETTGVAPVDAKFNANVTSGMVPLTVLFTDQSIGSITSRSWDLDGDGRTESNTTNPTFVYNKPGVYNVSLVLLGNGTTDKETKMAYITAVEPVKALFTADITEDFGPFATTFTDKSLGTPTGWKWDFNNDGITDATTQNPTYAFTQPGSYSVRLIVSNIASTDTLLKTLFIKVKSKATLPYKEDFDNEWVNYSATRDVPSFNWINEPAEAMYSWSREDDGVSRGAWNSNDGAYSPAGADNSLHSARFHTYDFASSYISGYYLNVDFSTLAGNKTLSFNYINPNGTDGLKVYLSTDGGKTLGTPISTLTTSAVWTKVSIDLGNITSSKGLILFTPFADLDNSDIGIDELTIQTTGVTPVVAQFIVDKSISVVNSKIKFTDMSSGNPKSWKWDFNNDGIIDSTSRNPSYVYTQPGNYTVKLISSNNGSTDTEVKINYITIENPVNAMYTSNKVSGENPLTVAFTDQSTGSPTSWKWDFNNDGTIDATVQNPSFTYTTSGLYSVKLIVSRVSSSDTIVKPNYITVIEPVVSNFVADKTIGEAPLNVKFTDQSTGNPSSWSWDINDNGTIDATTQNLNYTFNSPGLYAVKLTVSKTGSSDSEIKTGYITVVSPVIAQFSANLRTGSVPLSVKFTDNSTGTPTAWEWDFNNDGVIDTAIQSPVHVFKNVGTYTVTLKASKLGSTNTIVKTNYIVVSPSTGIDLEGSNDFGLDIYPNPTNSFIHIKTENNSHEIIKIEVVDIIGTIVKTVNKPNQQIETIDMTHYVDGVYYLRIWFKEKIITKKFIFKK